MRADLDAYGVATTLVPTLVRGLDYYTRTTWEFIGPMDNENSTISGGGRYDGLVEEIGGPPTPGVGFGAGIERLLIAMEDEGVADAAAPTIDVFFALEPDAPRERSCRRLLQELRDAGVAADTDYAGRSLKGQLTQAARLGAATTRDRPAERRADPPRRAGRTNRSPTRDFVGRLSPMSVARPTCAASRARSTSAARSTLVRLGRAPPRPRRPRLRRPARPHRDHAARDQPRAGARGGRARARDPQRVRPPGRGRGSSRAPETRQPEHADRRRRAAGRHSSRSSRRSTPLPFQLDEENVDETLRLRYRWLDLRRDKLQRNITLRAQMVGIIRREMEAAGFLDIQTPILFKPTPEGARDFVVPSRLQQGRFFALPQSPQILKQLTMVAGFDRYYQIAICFRDEDLRADRVQEITQLDVEMSLPRPGVPVRADGARCTRAIWRECLGIEIATPFPRMTYEEADRRFGSDKPDTALRARDRGRDRGRRAAPSSASSRAPRRCGSCACRRSLSRGELAKLEERREGVGREGARLPRVRRGRARSARRSRSSSPRRSSTRFAPAPGDDAALRRRHVGDDLARARCAAAPARTRARPDRRRAAFTFLWVTDFPMFEWDEDEGRWTAVHHPFTRPTDGVEGDVSPTIPEHALAHAYDLIVNGNELGGGSFRIHEPEHPGARSSTCSR